MRHKHAKILVIILISMVLIFKFTFISINIDDEGVKRCYKEPLEETIKEEDHRTDILLVLFTTFKENSDHHAMIHRLAITNWASLGRAVKPVLFSNEEPENISNYPNLCQLALTNGWDVLPIPSANKYGTPHLRAMYEKIFERYEAQFYGYANGDLLFEDGLVMSLLYVETILHKGLRSNVLMVGRRTDIFFSVPDAFLKSIYSQNTQIYLENLNKRFDISNLKNTARGLLAPPDAIDYFLFTKNGSTFKWNDVVDVVIGRKGYDQYILFKAKEFGVTTIDLTSTVLTVHLFRNGGHENIDVDYNYEVIGFEFPYSKGLITKTDFYSLHEALTDGIVIGKMYPPLRQHGCINFTH